MLDGAAHNKIEKRYIRKNRELLWANRTGGLIRDDAGNPRQFLIMVEDITERVRSERRRVAQYKVADLLNRSWNPEEAAPEILKDVASIGE